MDALRSSAHPISTGNKKKSLKRRWSDAVGIPTLERGNEKNNIV
jgi:hypothetical protein